VGVYRSFSDTITNLELEEVKSEYQRSVLIIILFFAIFIISIINFLLVSETTADYYGGTPTFLKVISWVAAFLIYQLLVLLYLKKKVDQKLKNPLTFKLIHATIEILFPSAIVIYMIDQLRMLSFIESPVTLTYFLFIIFSVMHLDFRVSLFTGLLASVVYTAIVYYGFNYADVAEIYRPSTPENSHYIRAFIITLCGGAAAFVSIDLKNRIRTTYDYQRANAELELLFGQHVSKEVSRALIEEKGATKRLEATVMFLDIRNFTSFADTHTPDEVIDYQNKFIGPVIEVINHHQGVVFQILGDGLMACFGSPVENVLHADMAFQASLKIFQQIRNACENNIIPHTEIGVGLHSGFLVAGNIGNDQRKQFSISGTPVIVASRIEQLNKKYGTQFLISGQVLERIAPGKITISYIGEEPLRGIGKPVAVYKVF
jgi:adenylate cyclase